MGRVCQRALGPDDQHPLHGACGGGVVLRHASVARAVGRMAADRLGVNARHAQRQPQLDKDVDGETVEAILDVVYQQPGDGQTLIDVRVCSPCAGEPAQILAAARRVGEAAARQVRNQEARYGDSVVPFVVETGGRPSKEAREWVRAVLRESIQDGTPAVLSARAWAHFSCTLQR